MTPDLMGLFPRLLQVMEHSREFLQVRRLTGLGLVGPLPRTLNPKLRD